MPYIPRKDRWAYDQNLGPLVAVLSACGWKAGHVTYVVYTIVQHWFWHNKKYQTICEIRGMLAGVLSEFNRRHADEYEDEKIKENEDIHTWDIEYGVPNDIDDT